MSESQKDAVELTADIERVVVQKRRLNEQGEMELYETLVLEPDETGVLRAVN